MEINKNFSAKATEDFKLVEQALSGDQAAYSAIMSRYRESIYYLVFKMVRNESDAEDLAIETFEKAFLKLNQYRLRLKTVENSRKNLTKDLAAHFIP